MFPSIVRKTTATSIFLIACAFSMAIAANYWHAFSQAKSDQQDQLGRQLNLLSDSLENPLWSLDKSTVDLIGKAFLANADVVSLEIVSNHQKEPFFTQIKKSDSDVLYGQSDIHHDNKVIGRVLIGLDRASHAEFLSQHLSYDLIVGSLIVLLFFFVSKHLLKRHLGEPLESLGAWTDRVASGNYEGTPPSIELKELSTLIHKFSNMSEKIQDREETLTYLVTHDSLTGLPNRSWLHTRLTEQIRECREAKCTVAVIMLGLNKFKEINDTMGRDFGDQVLKQFAQRFKNTFPGLEIARLAGDEFVVVLQGRRSREDIKTTTHALTALFSSQFYVNEIGVAISPSIGIACYPDDGETENELLRKADIAMSLAKTQLQGISFYDAEKDRNSWEKLQLVAELREAIEEDQITLFYQPKVSLTDGRIMGYEALLRWHHPVKGMISPNAFLPYVEMSDLIVPLTTKVIELSLTQWRTMADLGMEVPISINLSPRMLMDVNLPDTLKEYLTRYDIPRGALEIELTETAIIADPDHARQFLKRIKDLGVRLSIDDYGTGFSSLTLLKELPIDALKIDMSFIRKLITSEEDSIIVKSTIDLARGLGLGVIAEGVEDHETMKVLEKFGCDEIQGFYIARPLAPDDITSWCTKITTLNASHSA